MNLICALILISAVFNLTISVENAENHVLLNVSSEDFVYTSPILKNITLKVPRGKYLIQVDYQNITYIKRVNVTKDTFVRFNLATSNNTSILSLSYHTLIIPTSHGFNVQEVYIIKNNKDINFDGDLAIYLPECTDLKIISSTLSFSKFELSKHRLIIKNLLVAGNGGGQIFVSYSLTSNLFERELLTNTDKVMIFTNAEVTEKSDGLIDKGVREFGNSKFRVLEGKPEGNYFVKLKSETEIKLNPLALAGISLIACSVFLLLYEKRGGWKL